MSDLIVVGAGPAGLATAIMARRAGMSVTVLDRAACPPVDKACGEGLMPDAVATLLELGVRLPAGVGQVFRGIRYVDGAQVAEGHFPGPPGLGVRRTALHAALVERAQEVEVEVRWGTRVEALGKGGVRATRGTVAGDLIVGADGLHSKVRAWAGLSEAPGTRLARFGVRRHFAIAPWTDHVEVHFGPRCEAYVTPVSGDEVGVAILWSGGKSDFDRLLEHWPELASRLRQARRLSADRGAGPLLQRVRGVQREGVALVGDASGYLDAITGEGIAVALHQAAALVAAAASGARAGYAAAHRRISRLPNLLTRLVLELDRRQGLRRRVLAALAADPALFSRLLGIHARSLPARDIGALATLRLLARVTTA